ncbi:pectinesterase family protein [Bacteroides acidifaciens]|jgi:pectinesterase|uniref:pectinesterase family protein n=1 Tax=Bacteroides acidifaciens TaxID=85831 RepID=UPI00158CF252|nr:pectinesterase family protein [Bacteroides acidifaciens]
MNTNSIYTISKYLLLFLLIFTGVACSDNDDAEDTSIPVLISQNINEGDVVGPNGYVELTFSKAMRQAPDTEIYFNGGIVRVSINYERVRYTFSGMENKECTFEIPAGALTDMQGRAYDEDFFLTFTAKSEISGGGKVFDAVVDSKGNGDFTTIQAAIDAVPGEKTSPYKIFITNGSYNECIRITKNKTFIHLIGESRDGVKIQYALNRAGNYNDETQGNATDDAWKYSSNNPNSAVRKAGYTKDQNCVVLVEATDFYAENLSIINLYGALPSRYTGGLGKDGQAEALITRNDRFSLYNCVLVSFQDTWWCRHTAYSENLAYLSNTLIEGRTDYIWGSGNVFIENSKFYNTGDGAYITASGETGTWGYIMKDCTVDGESGITAFSFGRPYKPNTKTVWINTTLKMDIIASHWSSWSSIPALYGEYNTVDKNGTVISTEGKTVGNGEYSFTSTVLTATEAAEYTYEKIVRTNGWNPKEYMETPLAAPGNVNLSGNELSWDAVSGASGYLIFMNGNYAGQTTDTTVTLTNTDESNIYTVKTVSQYGTVSE